MGALLSSSRKISKISPNYNLEEPVNNEADSNVDTCCLGSNFIIYEMTNRTADVYPYDISYSNPIKNVPIISGATAWDDSETGETIILIINEGLCYSNKLQHSLLNPNQIRHHGIGFWDNPYDMQHQLCIDVNYGPLKPL
mmetsp:Transcript_12720/g.18121  ORF Transcript_12720/g.18121 Transcript_12720/m.18121 type:complete len:140 (-) Transcript_12720:150-569(-)